MAGSVTTPASSRRATVIAELLRHSRVAMAAEAVADDTPLLDGGLALESVAFLEALIAIEGALGLRLVDEDMPESAVRSVGGLVAYVDAASSRAVAARDGDPTPGRG